MQGQKVVKVFCHEEKSIEEFKELNDKLFHSADNANKFANSIDSKNTTNNRNDNITDISNLCMETFS